MRTDGARPRGGDEDPGPGSPAPGGSDAAGGEAPERAWVWPAAIIIGLLLVMAVNAAYIVVAVGGADEVVESYLTEER